MRPSMTESHRARLRTRLCRAIPFASVLIAILLIAYALPRGSTVRALCALLLLFVGSVSVAVPEYRKKSGCLRALAAGSGCVTSCIMVALLQRVETREAGSLGYMLLSLLCAGPVAWFIQVASKQAIACRPAAYWSICLLLPLAQVFAALATVGAERTLWVVQIGHAAWWWLASVILLLVSGEGDDAPAEKGHSRCR